MNEVYTKSALTKQFDRYFSFVLSEYLEMLPYERHKQRKYQVKKPLPTREEYAVLRNKHFETSVSDLVSDAFDIFEELNDELQNWYDNLPENFQNGDKGSQIQEATDVLSNLSTPDVPECLEPVSIVYLPGLDRNSRAERNGEATSQLQAVYDAVEEILDSGKINGYDNEGKSLAERDITDDERDELESFRDEIDSAKNEAEGISFPGMY